MDYLSLLIIGIVIGSNNFAVAISLGALNLKKKLWRIIGVFGFFEFIIPLIGAAIGIFFIDFLDEYASKTSALLLIGLGLYSIYGTFFRSKEDTQNIANKISTWKGLIFLSIGLGLDNMVIGVSMGIKNQSPLVLASVISFCSMLFTWLGIHLGHYLKIKTARLSNALSGILLIALGILTFIKII